ncbi:MAG: hypothetical protein ACRCYY_19355 [Trueperaceae bacterium]
MAVSKDVHEAKNVLSRRLLRKNSERLAELQRLSSTASFVTVERTMASTVHAVGVGRKVVNGKTTTTPAIRLHVARKLPMGMLPKRARLPESIEGIPTDIIESAPARIAARARTLACTNNRKKRQRPIVAGISVAHEDITAGTLGYFCRSTKKGDDPNAIFILSNNHVLANVNLGKKGDAVMQPGPIDGGTPEDDVATLHRFVRIKLGGRSENVVDCAIAEVLPDTAYEANLCEIGKVKGVLVGSEGMKICKHGRTTGYTEGTITDELYDALVGMSHEDPNEAALFTNQLRLEVTSSFEAIGLGGDSGSLVVSKKEKKAVGLYFAGPENGQYGIANPIKEVLELLEIELL